MPREATLKDVLYALEFTGARLCRWPQAKAGSRPAWSLEPGGLKVSTRTADDARKLGNVVEVPAPRHGQADYKWTTHPHPLRESGTP